MLWCTQIFLNKDLVVTECFLGFVFCFVKLFLQIFHRVYDTHTASATTVGSFQHNRKTDFGCNFCCCVNIFDRVINTGNNRYLRINGHFFGRNLIAHCIHDLAGRSDKYDAVSLTGIYKIRIL